MALGNSSCGMAGFPKLDLSNTCTPVGTALHSRALGLIQNVTDNQTEARVIKLWRVATGGRNVARAEDVTRDPFSFIVVEIGRSGPISRCSPHCLCMTARDESRMVWWGSSMRRRLAASSSRTIAGRSSPDHQTLIAIVISAVVPTHRPSRWITTKITPRPSGATLGRPSFLLAGERGRDRRGPCCE